MNPQTIVFILSTLFTAYVFFNLGFDQGKKKFPHRKVHFILDDIYEAIAEEFYPNDPEAKMKVSDRMARRSFERLKEFLFERHR